MKKTLEQIMPQVLAELNESKSCTTTDSARRDSAKVGRQAVVDVL